VSALAGVIAEVFVGEVIGEIGVEVVGPLGDCRGTLGELLFI
jgi:hypothetical protein